MDLEGYLIWGDDDEATVFAQAQNGNLRLIFKFSSNQQRRESIPSKIVTCFHDIETSNPKETFPDMNAMREEVWSSIRQVWDQCATDPDVRAPDTIVEIDEDSTGSIQGHLYHETSMYQSYTGSLLPLNEVFSNEEFQMQGHRTVQYNSLEWFHPLPGRGTTTVVRISSTPESLFVFKGIDFGAYLDSPAIFPSRRDMCYHEMRTVRSLPRHANIVSPPEILVTVGNTDDNQQDLLCGTLYPFLKEGSLDDKILAAKSSRTSLAIADKVKWCYEMCSAVYHTHRVAQTYHMDIKPGNFLVNEQNSVMLGDWEQSGAPRYTLAPEADGSWDVEFETSSNTDKESSKSPERKLVYRKYRGPPRKNIPYGSPRWSVFKEWIEDFPEALEAAEVFSLGRTTWMVLAEISQDEIEHLDVAPVTWTEVSNHVPDSCKAMVLRCLDPDPNQRVKLGELLEFWGSVHNRIGINWRTPHL